MAQAHIVMHTSEYSSLFSTAFSIVPIYPCFIQRTFTCKGLEGAVIIVVLEQVEVPV